MNALILPIIRTFSTSCRRTAKPGYFLHRLIERGAGVEKKILKQEENKLLTVKRLPPEATRRQRVLNALYMETISGVLASELGARLAAHSITVVEVRINYELTIINVYWISNSDPFTEVGLDEIAEAMKALREIAPEIRAELSAVRHMGIIPRIHFIHYSGMEKGKDVIAKLDQLRAAGELEDVEPAVHPVLEEIPDVYGLDRNKILAELKAKSAPADGEQMSYRVNMDTEYQEAVLKRIRLKRTQKKKSSVLSSRERSRLERQIYEDVFLNP